MPLVRSLKRSEAYTGTANIESVIQSGPQSWGETALDFQATPPQYDDGKDAKGPVDMGLSVDGAAADAPASGTARKTRIVIFGTSDLASNRMLQFPQIGNADLFVNAVNWLAEEEALISIRPPTTDTRPLELTQQQSTLVGILLICLMPGLVALTGFSIWWRRR